jgi:nucleoside-diphosphate-sugar epimerase
MRVLVTGISGRVGAAVAEDLLANGHEVVGFDKMPLGETLRGRVQMQYADITDRYALLRATEGCEAITHLAAIPNPIHGTEKLFDTNVTGTQYVLEAAEAQGIKRVALASSCCALGLVFAKHPFDPEYFPVDEKHPDKPQDLYGLSKVVNEQTAAAYSRRTGMTTVALRLTLVATLTGEHPQWRKRMLRHSRNWRSPEFWTYVDIRDTARAFRLSIEVPLEGSHTLIIAARDAFTPYDVRDLIREHYPALSEYADQFGPQDALYDTTLAEQTIGFVAEHSWRDNPELADILEEAEKEKHEAKQEPK